jgi:hypothetical protein
MELLRRPEHVAAETVGDHDVIANRDAVHTEIEGCKDCRIAGLPQRAFQN